MRRRRDGCPLVVGQRLAEPLFPVGRIPGFERC